MPVSVLWTLVISLIMLLVAVSLKLAESLHTNDLLRKEIKGSIEQVAMLKQEHEEVISNHSEFDVTIADELAEKYEAQINDLLLKVAELENPSNARLIEQLSREIDEIDKTC